jgi:hypothetical protein
MSSLHDINEEDRLFIGVFNTARYYFTKVRNKVHGYTPIGYNDIIEKYTKIIDGRKFHHHDIGYALR